MMKNHKQNVVYVLRHKGWPDYVKIGVTSNLSQRLKSLETASPLGIDIVHVQPIKNNFLVENYLHQYYHKYHCHGEWYRLSQQQVLDLIFKLNDLALQEENYYKDSSN